jgi:hypothetical protein
MYTKYHEKRFMHAAACIVQYVVYFYVMHSAVQCTTAVCTTHY